MALTILSCIADNEQYLVKNPRIRELIFKLVKEKIKNQALVITPNMFRFLALKLIAEDQSLIIKVENTVFSSDNRARLLIRTGGTFIIAFIGSLFTVFSYAVLIAIIYFMESENCGYNCDSHFQHLPKDEPVTIYAEKPSKHIVITDNSQVDIFVPTNEKDIVQINQGTCLNPEMKDQGTCLTQSERRTPERRTVIRKYKQSNKKYKTIKFSEFRKKDPVLSSFKDAEEPNVPQKSCKLTDPHDLLDIRID